MIRPRIEPSDENISHEMLLANGVGRFLAYPSSPEFPQSYHTLWKTHIEGVRALHRKNFAFRPSHMVLG
jgi:hypothetical protein